MMFVPDLSPLFDAKFETDDDDQVDHIHDIVVSWENHSPWPLRFFRSGEAAKVLKPFGLKALATVVRSYDDEMDMRRAAVRRALRFPPPFPPVIPPPPPNVEFAATVQEAMEDDSDDDVVEIESPVVPEIPVVDLISNSDSGDVVVKKGKKKMNKGKRKVHETSGAQLVPKEFDPGMDEEPDVPFSPCVSEEYDPRYHYFLLLKRGNPSAQH